MRVLSFIPALLLAAAGFVGAAPTARDSSPAQTLQTTIQGATTQLQSHYTSLSSIQGNPSEQQFSTIVVDITATVKATVSQVQAIVVADVTADVDLNGLALDICSLLNVVVQILVAVVSIVLTLGAQVVGSLQGVLCDLGDAVAELLHVVVPYAINAVSIVLNIVIAAVEDILKLLVHVLATLNVNISLNL